jgi:nucleotide-binding universal stress UspA family protein
MDQMTMRSARSRGNSPTPTPSRRRIPVAKVKPASARRKLGIRRIIVPVDFSEKANRALAYAVDLAHDMDAKIILLHVIEPVYVANDPGLTYIPAQTVTAEHTSAQKRIQKLAADWIPKDNFEKAVIRVGSPYHEITAAAQSLKADILVIGTHGRTGLSHVLMGSTAERVVRHATCPVLTVRRAK